MERIRRHFDSSIWSTNLILFAAILFLDRFGEGLLNGARMNFFIDTLRLTEGQVLWLEGIRELPGLGLIFIAALTMRLPLLRQGTLSLLLMGVGYGLYALVGSYSALLLASIIASFGFHMWTPLHSAIGLSLSNKDNAGRVLGTLASVGSLAAIAGMGAIALVSLIFESIPLGAYYVAGGVAIILAGLLLSRLPATIGATDAVPPRILVKPRYWRYYVLIFFSGARKLVLGSLITLILVQNFDLKVWQVSTLTLVSSVLTLLATPYLGALIDRLGERVTTPVSYIILALCCVGYALLPHLWILVALWLLIKVVTPLGLGLSTYVYRTAPPEELTPTLSAGVTFDHISSVGMPFVATALIPLIAYRGIFLATAVLTLISIPFARALQIEVSATPQPVPAGAE